MPQEYTLSSHGYWVGTNLQEEHMFDSNLADAIANFIPKTKSVIDLGCGMGNYVRRLREAGFDCDGVDGNPDTPELSGGMCRQANLARPLSLPKVYDWALSLEVAEHIPAKYERVYLENLHCMNREGIIVSWALPGQTGLGHVNCRDSEYVRCRLQAMGYEELVEAGKSFRSQATLEWFKYTVMVFKRMNPLTESNPG